MYYVCFCFRALWVILDMHPLGLLSHFVHSPTQHHHRFGVET